MLKEEIDSVASQMYDKMTNVLSYIDAKDPTKIASKVHVETVNTMYEVIAENCPYYEEHLPENGDAYEE